MATGTEAREADPLDDVGQEEGLTEWSESTEY